MLLFKRNVSLAPYTTINIGGNSKLFTVVKREEELKDVSEYIKSTKIPYVIIGGGSNIIVSDDGFNGLVIKNEIPGFQIINEDNDFAVVKVGSGLNWDNFVSQMVYKSYSGIESLSGIPGTVGGVPIQNVGAYGQEASEIIQSVSIFNITNGQRYEIDNKSCLFSYRNSIFKETGNLFITHVTFKLQKSRYSLQDLVQKRYEVLRVRKDKSTLYSRGDPDSISAGSYFLNPVVTDEVFNNLCEKYPDIPSWSVDSNKRKLSAGWLIEKSGINKGYKINNVGLSKKHALIVVNLGGGTSEDILKLEKLISESVYNNFNVRLKREPVFIGE